MFGKWKVNLLSLSLSPVSPNFAPVIRKYTSTAIRVMRLTLACHRHHRLDTERREGTLPLSSPLAPPALPDAGLTVGPLLLLLLLLHVLLVVVVEALLLLGLILVNVVVYSWSRNLASKLPRRVLKLLLLLRLLLLLLCLPDVADVGVVHDQFRAGDYPGDYNSV